MAKRLTTKLHLYPLSRLVFARPGQWERILHDIEDDKNRAYGYYQPMREAVIRLCRSGLDRRERVLARLNSDAGNIPTGRNQNPTRDNLLAFEVFERSFYPRIGEFQRSLLRENREGGVVFEGIQLTGLPHFVATDKHNATRYIFLYASQWRPEVLNAYLQLLAEVVRIKYDGDPKSIWCMNLRTGRTEPWKSRIRVRNSCIDAIRLYCRLADGSTTL